MDFLDPKKKRAHIIRLYIGYTLMAIVLAIGTRFLFLAADGIVVDPKTGTVFQNGLISIDAHPETAHVFINNVDKGTTSRRLALPEGKYEVELRSNGYKTWKQTVNLLGGRIEQLVYPFLFPEKLLTKQIVEISAPPDVVSQSPNGHWLVMHSPPSENIFEVVDLSTPKHPVSTIKLPTDTISPAQGAHSFEAIEWSSDNTHLLLKHNFTGGSEFIILNRENPTASVNLNKLIPAQAFNSVSLRDKRADQYYLFNSTNGNLYSANNNDKAPVLLVSSVVSYKSYVSDTLVYIAGNVNSPAVVEVHVRKGDKDHLLRTLPLAPKYLIDIAGFDGSMYLVSGSTADGRVYVYKNPLNDFGTNPVRTPQPSRVLVVQGAQFVSFSANARFISVQGGSNFAVYDIEAGRQFKYDTKLALGIDQKAVWMDGHRLMLVSGGAVNVFDFDGTNMQILSPALPAYAPLFDRDFSAMFTLATATDKIFLTRTELKVPPSGQNNQ